MLNINTNMMSIMAQNNLSKTNEALNTATERLSSGLRINSAKDDAAGLALATGFETDIRTKTMQIRNINDGISFAQTGEAALGEVTNMMQRIIELQEQKAGGVVDAAPIDDEIGELVDEINAQLGETFSGTAINGATLTVDGITVGGTAVTAVTAASDFSAALDDVNTLRAEYGAQQNRLESRSRFLSANVENLEAAKARIMDADFAKETANLAKAQILQQAGVAMLAQANQMPQTILGLLR